MTTAPLPSLVLPQHNDRYQRISIVITANGSCNWIGSFTIYDAIVWIVDNETIDIVQYGNNLPSTIIYRSDIISIEDTGDEAWRRACTIIIRRSV